MKHFNYLENLEAIWKKSCDLYTKGQRGADTYFSDSDLQFLSSIGISGQEMYDYAEDFVSAGVPTFATVVAEVDARRNYFLEIQKGVPSEKVLDPSDLPGKEESIEGIDWIPRIIPKAKAKLRGELSPDIMYGCGGDRRFLHANDIHSAEFLRVVWASDGDDQKIIDWVKNRRGSLA